MQGLGAAQMAACVLSCLCRGEAAGEQDGGAALLLLAA